MLLPEPDRPLTRTSCMARTAELPAEMLLLTLNEFLSAVDTAQLQHVIAHRRLDQHRQVAPGRHRKLDLADVHPDNFLRAGVQRQPFHARDCAADRLLELDDELE